MAGTDAAGSAALDAAPPPTVTAGDAGSPAEAGSPAVDGMSSAPRCTSGIYNYTAPNGPTMLPGVPCLSCHLAGGGGVKALQIAGTVYPAAHDDDQCVGSPGLTVVITDARGASLSLPTSQAGSFYSTQRVAFPIHAKVVDSQGRTRAMMAAQSTGDCNSCHTIAGDNGAPGRILIP